MTGPQPYVREKFIAEIADIARTLGLGPDWCLSQPGNREAWERVAAAMEGGRPRLVLIQGGNAG